MSQRIREWEPDVDRVGQHCGCLLSCPARFAKWRWKTIHDVVRDLHNLHPTLCFINEHADNLGRVFAIRDSSMASAVQAAIAEDVFWSQRDAIDFIVSDVIELMNWIQGCQCHESELKAGKNISCNKKGCRAKDLAQRLQQTKNSLLHLRQSLTEGLFQGVSVLDISNAISFCISVLDAKFKWISELPYLVWQVLLYSV